MVDALLTGNWPAFWSARGQLVLPLATLVLVYMPLVLKTARSTMEEMLIPASCCRRGPAAYRGDAAALRTPQRTAAGDHRHRDRFWFLLGGAVLVETIFAWGGLGQYAVESVINSDYAPIQAVVLVTAVFTTLVFLVVDILYFCSTRGSTSDAASADTDLWRFARLRPAWCSDYASSS